MLHFIRGMNSVHTVRAVSIVSIIVTKIYNQNIINYALIEIMILGVGDHYTYTCIGVIWGPQI